MRLFNLAQRGANNNLKRSVISVITAGLILQFLYKLVLFDAKTFDDKLSEELPILILCVILVPELLKLLDNQEVVVPATSKEYPFYDSSSDEQLDDMDEDCLSDRNEQTPDKSDFETHSDPSSMESLSS